ncbi:hypothetical protein TNCV_1670971 [Trichonephila clavipes]|nr:hypothetical protein TNCV_1670971 [Trichonephila clavipes]
MGSEPLGNEYLSHLENVVQLLIEDWVSDVDGIYQDSSATPHHVKTIQTWFNYYNDVFHLLKWPSKSPDIRVIGNL